MAEVWVLWEADESPTILGVYTSMERVRQRYPGERWLPDVISAEERVLSYVAGALFAERHEVDRLLGAYIPNPAPPPEPEFVFQAPAAPVCQFCREPLPSLRGARLDTYKGTDAEGTRVVDIETRAVRHACGPYLNPKFGEDEAADA